MAVVLLQSVPAIREYLGYDSGSKDVDAAILSSLEKTTQTLEGALRTKFERGVAQDTFLARNLRFGFSGIQKSSKVKLTRGLVDTGQTITIRGSPTLKGLDESGQWVDLRDNGGQDHLLIEDAEKGRIVISDFSFSGLDVQYIRVGYTCGLTNDGGDPPLYDSAPDWLVNLATTQAELHTMHNPALNPGLDTQPKKVQGETGRVMELRRALEIALQDHVCYAPGYAKAWGQTFTAS